MRAQVCYNRFIQRKGMEGCAAKPLMKLNRINENRASVLFRLSGGNGVFCVVATAGRLVAPRAEV